MDKRHPYPLDMHKNKHKSVMHQITFFSEGRSRGWIKTKEDLMHDTLMLILVHVEQA